MIEPSIELQTVLRSVLIADDAITSLVAPQNIRSGSTRPDAQPSIILAGGSTEFLGRTSKERYLARVNLDLHIWAIESGADIAKAIGFLVSKSVINMGCVFDELSIDEMDKPRTIWLRDAQPEQAYTHGVMEIEAVVRFDA